MMDGKGIRWCKGYSGVVEESCLSAIGGLAVFFVECRGGDGAEGNEKQPKTVANRPRQRFRWRGLFENSIGRESTFVAVELLHRRYFQQLKVIDTHIEQGTEVVGFSLIEPFQGIFHSL